MTFKFPDLSRQENIFKLNPVLNNVEAFKGLSNEEMCFVVLMCDAMSPFRYSKSEADKIKSIIEIIPSVRGGLQVALQKRFQNYKKHYFKAFEVYINTFSSKSDLRKLKGREALLNTFDQFCELYSNIDLLGDNTIEKMDKETLDNIKQISDMVKKATITDLDEQLELLEKKTAFVVDMDSKDGLSSDPEDIISSL